MLGEGVEQLPLMSEQIRGLALPTCGQAPVGEGAVLGGCDWLYDILMLDVSG